MLAKCLTLGVKFLKESQQNDGSFLSFSSNTQNFNKSIPRKSPFYTSLILVSLSSLGDNKELLGIQQKAGKFIWSQKSKHLSFNYWQRNSEESKKNPYPDDLDDTFCALSAIYKINPKLLDGKSLAKAIELLTFLEVKEGGPYKTWIVDDKAPSVWKDVDFAVNSNIAYFLSLIDVDLPNLNGFIEKGIKENELNSPYYYTNLPVIYFISRFYKGELREKLVDLILSLQKSKAWWGDPMSTSLAVSSLINLGFIEQKILKNSINKLISYQKNGFWKEAPFVIEAKKKSETIYAGSKYLTTAFCLEAISLYLKTIDTVQQSKAEEKFSLKIQEMMIGRAKKRLSSISPQIESGAIKILDTILKMNEKNQITLLPFIFKEISRTDAKKVSGEFLMKCSLANLYGWIAYTIYDDFLDDEGDSLMLSVANISLREMVSIFEDFSYQYEGFGKIYKDLMDKIDSANAWEIEFCRGKTKKLPDFGDNSVLAYKSLGIALTPVAILFCLGYKANSAEIRLTIKFFKHYLIARQLNDDAHDWEDDLKMNHLTPVVSSIIHKSKKNPHKSYEEIFWYESIVDVCKEINWHLVEAKKCIVQNKSIKDGNMLEKMLKPIENAVGKVMSDREKTIDFISAYDQSKIT